MPLKAAVIIDGDYFVPAMLDDAVIRWRGPLCSSFEQASATAMYRVSLGAAGVSCQDLKDHLADLVAAVRRAGNVEAARGHAYRRAIAALDCTLPSSSTPGTSHADA